MNKSVGMITFYQNNYGAFLQAYALQQMLISLGLKPEIIRYDFRKDQSVLGIPLYELKKPKRFLTMLVVEIIRHKAHHRRDKVFENSIKENLLESSAYYKKYKELQSNPPQYDLYVTGSDQVFNPELSRHTLKARLLCFVKEGKKLSYAASAGKGEISEAYLDEFKNALRTFTAVSVRESGLRDFVDNKKWVNAVHNIDPTLLLSKEEWMKFAQTDETVNGDYIFYYRVQKQEALFEKARLISDQLGLPIYVANGSDKFPNQIPREGDLSPEKWVGMMIKAAYVVTNSFHGTAFALNLGKRVSIVVPPVWGDRVTDLLRNCELAYILDDYLMPEDVLIVYSRAEAYFDQERKRAKDFFAKVIESL